MRALVVGLALVALGWCGIIVVASSINLHLGAFLAALTCILIGVALVVEVPDR